MKDKIIYSENIFYEIIIPESHQVIVKKGDILTNGKVIARTNIETKVYKIAYTGKLLIKEHDILSVGDEISKPSKLKPNIKSNIAGEVVKIDNEYIYVEDSKPEILKEVEKPKKYELDNTCAVDSVVGNSILIQISGIVINLFDAKGPQTSAELLILDSSIKKIKEKDLAEKVIISDILIQDLYPKLVALGAAAVVANSCDYPIYSDIINPSIPLGIYSGFGQYKFDDEIIHLLKQYDGSKIIIDANYKRIIIPENRKPAFFMKDYNFIPPI